jgi:3-keto-5-aminohexanoate cleavage enzyme
MSDGLLITAAINGAEITRAQTPALPITPDEVGLESLRCRDAGAAMIHLHGRRADGSPTQDAATFAAYFAAIRDRSDIIVQFSTGGAIGMSVEERIAALILRPEMATLTTGTCNFGDDIFANPMPAIRAIAASLRANNIRPEIEVFDLGMLDTAIRLHREGLLDGDLHVDFVFGVPGAMEADAGHLRYLVSRLPAGWSWCVAGIGRHELVMARHALEWGGHVRVGLEDNIFLRKGQLAAGSYELVAEVARMAAETGRTPWSVTDARARLGLPEVRYPHGL